MKRLVYYSILLGTMAACGPRLKQGDVCNTVEPSASDSRPEVLVIGDSISYGYTPTVQRELGADLNVNHSDCSARHTRWTLANLDKFLGHHEHYRLITWNNGLWDIVPFYEVSEDTYRDNLRVIGTRLKAQADHVMWFSTSYVPPGIENRDSDRADRYNEIASEVMNELGIPVYDLNAYSRTISGELLPNDIHYTVTGYELLGEFVTQSIRTELGL